MGLLVAAVAAGIILYWGGQRPYALAVDDAFITYRYAHNLRQGFGLVFNPGEPVLGTTAPLWALLLAAAHFVVDDLPWLGHWGGVACWVAAAWLALALLWGAGRPVGGMMAALLLALQPLFLHNLGMESHLVVALMLGTAWAWLGGRQRLTMLLAAALLLARQDSALWLLLLGLEVWRREGRLPWRVAAGTVLLTLPWFLFAWWQYGSPLPNSASAKMGQASMMVVAGQGAFARRLGEVVAQFLPWWGAAAWVTAVAGGLAVIWRQERRFGWLPAWALLYGAIYTGLGVANFDWYFIPLVAALNLIAALGLGALLGEGRPQMGRWAPAAGLLLLLLWLPFQWRALAQTAALRGHRPAYTAIGHWLAQNTPPQADVAAIEIGVIGYYSQRPLLDTMGLVSPDMTRHQVGWVETLVYALNVHRPDYAVVLAGTGWDHLRGRWWFEADYEPVQAFGDGATVYRRREREPAYVVTETVNFTGGLQVTGAEFSRRNLPPGTDLDLWLRLAVAQTPPVNVKLTVYLVDTATGARTAVTTVDPFDGGYHSRRWQPGDRLALPVRLRLPADLAPGAYRLGLRLYDPALGAGLPLNRAPQTVDPDVQWGWLRAQAPPAAAGVPGLVPVPVRAGWQSGIHLDEVRLPATAVAPGSGLPLALVWRAERPQTRDLTVFVHLIDAAGNIVAQVDERPLNGRWPTPVWLPDEVMVDSKVIAIPAGVPPGQYGLRLGWYDGRGNVPLAGDGAEFVILPAAITVE